MKTCNCCKTEKSFDEFGKDKNKPDGLNKTCKECRNKRQKELFLSDPERHRSYKRKYEKANKEKIAAKKRLYRLTTRDKSRTRLREWRAANPDKVEIYFHRHKHSTKLSKARRRAIEERATPAWLTENQISEMKAVYKSAQVQSEFHEIEFQVDHIEPLRGETSCGLCVPWNLQTLPRKENRTKSNKLNQPVIKNNTLCHLPPQ